MYPFAGLIFYPQTCGGERHTKPLWANLVHPCAVAPQRSPESPSPHLVSIPGHPRASPRLLPQWLGLLGHVVSAGLRFVWGRECRAQNLTAARRPSRDPRTIFSRPDGKVFPGQRRGTKTGHPREGQMETTAPFDRDLQRL